jgi:hypothetical protein
MRDSTGRRRRRPRAILASLLCAICVAATADPAVDADQAAAVKAAYLRYIAVYTLWPEDAFEAPGDSVVIGVLGEDRSGVIGIMRSRIESRGLLAQQRPIEIRHIARPPDGGAPSDLGDCHILFVSESERSAWPALHSGLEGRPIVTVSEIDGFAHTAGMIELTVDREDSRVELVIAIEAVRRAKLQISSRLLGLEVVTVLRPPAGEEPSG